MFNLAKCMGSLWDNMCVNDTVIYSSWNTQKQPSCKKGCDPMYA